MIITRSYGLQGVSSAAQSIPATPSTHTHKNKKTAGLACTGRQSHASSVNRILLINTRRRRRLFPSIFLTRMAASHRTLFFLFFNVSRNLSPVTSTRAHLWAFPSPPRPLPSAFLYLYTLNKEGNKTSKDQFERREYRNYFYTASKVKKPLKFWAF